MKVIFDFDGTLCDITHRRHHVADGNRNWDAFFAECVNDIPKMDIINTLISHVGSGHDVQIWSGRSAQVRNESEAWLDKYVFPGASKLLKKMRPEKNYIPDQILKRQWLLDSISQGWTPDIVYDDRKRVVDMWRDEGITCAQVDPGDFDKPEIDRTRGLTYLYVMIGPSGSGKSTFIQQRILSELPECVVVSSDEVRKNLYWDEETNAIDQMAYTPRGFANTFGLVRQLVKTYIDAGCHVAYDATNLRRKDRMEFLKGIGILDEDGNVIRKDVRVIYTVIERTLEEKLESYEANPKWNTNPDIIKKHHETFEASKKDVFKGDGYSSFIVVR